MLLPVFQNTLRKAGGSAKSRKTSNGESSDEWHRSQQIRRELKFVSKYNISV
jgi:hypothetical protein